MSAVKSEPLTKPDYRFALKRVLRARSDLDQALSGLGLDQRHDHAYVAIEQAYRACEKAMTRVLDDADDRDELREIVVGVDRSVLPADDLLEMS